MARSIEARPAELEHIRAGHVEKKEREKVAQDTIETAYFFVLNQFTSLPQWETIKKKPHRQIGWDNERAAIDSFQSHYNAIYNYMGDCIVGGPETLPDNRDYKMLFQATKDGYDELDRKKLRFIFIGEAALDREDAGRVISLGEFQSWVQEQSGHDDGITRVEDPTRLAASNITEIQSSFDVLRILQHTDTLNENTKWVDRLNESTFTRFPDETFQLGVYKLACGMAIIDQLVHEAAILGHPLPADYLPPRRENVEDYDKLPTLSELWKSAHTMLRDLSDPEDELLQHLFGLEKLEELAA